MKDWSAFFYEADRVAAGMGVDAVEDIFHNQAAQRRNIDSSKITGE
jgi:hypothetical protein